MVLKKNKEVIHIYNKKKETLVITFLDENHSIYTVGGWFGKKLDKFLKGDGVLESFFGEADFKENAKLLKTFKRLIVTLIEADIFLSPSDDSFVSIEPLSEKEWESFGEGELRGSLSVEEFNGSEILASAHAGTNTCINWYEEYDLHGIPQYSCLTWEYTHTTH